ncbi:MAG: efflux transporter [Pseudomonas sp.]|nr:efflux transporter [Pseudomonas sp.]
MAVSSDKSGAMPVVRHRADFDASTGNFLERLIFNYRWVLVFIFVISTVLLGFQAMKLKINANFERMLPHSQPFIKNYLDNRNDLRSLGNSIRIVVENKSGDIYDPAYLSTLQKINDTIFLIPGVDRSLMKSLWTPSVRWTQITEEGYRGGAVMPDDYDGSPTSVEHFKNNVATSGIVGRLVANDQHSSMIFVPLLDRIEATGQPLDYSELSQTLEQKIRVFESDSTGVYVVGFAKLAGDLIAGLNRVMSYFAIAMLVAGIAIFAYTRCVRSTLLVLGCSMAAVIWQLGIVQTLGFELDPYSMLVPFLVFAIGVSHGAQKMNGIMQDVGRGTHRYVAARYTFRRLFLAGLTALMADVVGFAVLMVIDIPVIQDLALTASIGVAVLIFTNLVLLPILLSFFGVSLMAAARTLKSSEGRKPVLAALLGRFTQRKWASVGLAAAALCALVGFAISTHLQVGDLDPGAPELRQDSRYNRDNGFITSHFGLSSDVFAVIVKTPPDGMSSYRALIEEDRLEQSLRQLDAVQTTESAANLARSAMAGIFEGTPKWATLNRAYSLSSQSTYDLRTNNPELINSDGSLGTVIAYLRDHKAGTLEAVVKVAGDFAESHSTDDVKFLLAAGSAGIEAATNIAVKSANRLMLVLVYVAVIVLCFITFRSWRAVIVAVVPLVLTSILCEALMVSLGIGVKVSTLPVVALGVGIGVDYALYLLSVQLGYQRSGLPLKEAYEKALSFTGNVVALVGVTLAAGVVTWAWSPIKFQADMGILLTFMFAWNMVGALVLIPALSHFLLPTSALTPGKGVKAAPLIEVGKVPSNRPEMVSSELSSVPGIDGVRKAESLRGGAGFSSNVGPAKLQKVDP